MVVLEFGLAISFVALLWLEWYRVAGILEWIVTFLRGFWLRNFVGYVS